MNVRFRPLILCLCILCFAWAETLSAQSKGSADLRLHTVVIDPGHGGKDPGTMSADKKSMEKTLALKISRMFAARIREAYPEVKVVMTRDKDVLIPLNTRAKIASDADAQLFISIHINGIARKSVNGFTAYILGPSNKSNYDSYEVNMEVCKRENSVIYLEDDTTAYKDYDESPESQILLQLMQNAFREQSLAFAETVSQHMGKTPFKKNWGVMQGNFAVLRRASMPAVLLEFGFITNADDLAILRSDDKIRTMVDRLFAAFAEYKTNYDKSVSIADPATPKAEPKQEGESKPAAAPSAVYYGTQVLASSRKMAPGDKFFKGFETEAVRVGSLYKYVAGPDEDMAKAKENYARIKKVFPDAFFVKVEDGQITRQK